MGARCHPRRRQGPGDSNLVLPRTRNRRPRPLRAGPSSRPPPQPGPPPASGRPGTGRGPVPLSDWRRPTDTFTVPCPSCYWPPSGCRLLEGARCVPVSCPWSAALVRLADGRDDHCGVVLDGRSSRVAAVCCQGRSPQPSTLRCPSALDLPPAALRPRPSAALPPSTLRPRSVARGRRAAGPSRLPPGGGAPSLLAPRPRPLSAVRRPLSAVAVLPSGWADGRGGHCGGCCRTVTCRRQPPPGSGPRLLCCRPPPSGCRLVEGVPLSARWPPLSVRCSCPARLVSLLARNELVPFRAGCVSSFRGWGFRPGGGAGSITAR